MKNGFPVLEATIRTAEKPYKLELIPDRDVINADGKDLSFVTVLITDKNGTLVPSADNLITFDISGAGFIAAMDNGYQASLESFKSSSRKAFNGKCLVVIKSAVSTGKITLIASSQNLISNTLILKAR